MEYNKAQLVDVVTFIMDRPKADGTVFRDRAFANVYVYEFNGNIDEFEFDLSEINGLVKVNARETLDLLKEEKGEILAQVIIYENGKNIMEEKQVSFNDFLINAHETGIDKYGDVLNKVIELTK